MNGKSFLVAMALICALAMVVTARDGLVEGPGADHRPPPLPHQAGGDEFDGSLGPQGPGPHEGRDRPRSPQRLTPEREEELLNKLKTAQPKVYKNLLLLRDRRPRMFRRAMAGLDRFYRRLEEMPEAMQKVLLQQRQDRVTRHELFRKYKQTRDKADRTALAARIRDVTARLFDADQKLREYRLEQLSKELAQMSADLKDRAARRTELIDQAVERFLQSGPPEL